MYFHFLNQTIMSAPKRTGCRIFVIAVISIVIIVNVVHNVVTCLTYAASTLRAFSVLKYIKRR